MDAKANCLDYLGQNKDWSDFNGLISDNTGSHYKDLWLKNLKANKERVKERGWAAEQLQDLHGGKAGVLLGASPAIKRQVDYLRQLQYDPDFVFIGITSGLKWLLDNGIKPKYCMIADADPKMMRFWEGLDMAKTKGVTLIANVLTAPEMLDAWQGDIKFLAIYTTIAEMDKEYMKLYHPVNGCGVLFAALCSQYNTGAAVAFTIFGCRTLIFVGNELSFPSKDSAKDKYYADRDDVKDSWLRKPHPDIYGNVAYTTYMFMALKLSLEDFLGRISGMGVFINATEAGIFGVTARYGNVSWISQMRLPTAVAQARHIIKHGKPMYEPPMIQRPTLQQVASFGGA